MGAGLGGEVGGSPGAAMGATIGASAGDALGGVFCKEDKDKDGSKDGNDPPGGPKKHDPDGYIVDPDTDFRSADAYERWATVKTVAFLPEGEGLNALISRSGGTGLFDIRSAQDALSSIMHTAGVSAPTFGERFRDNSIGQRGVVRDALKEGRVAVGKYSKKVSRRFLDDPKEVEVGVGYDVVQNTVEAEGVTEDGKAVTVSVPISQTITFPLGSAGAIKFPNGLTFGLDVNVSPRLISNLLGKADVDPIRNVKAVSDQFASHQAAAK